MPKKSYNYAHLEAVAQEMLADPEMVFFCEYQTPTGSRCISTGARACGVMM